MKQKQRSPYWTAVGFYPLLGGLGSAEQARAAGRHLLGVEQGGSGRFVTPWPTPTVPPDDPHFAADPMWRGERANCPWNGRVWPMVNSHIVDVLGELALQEPELYRPQLARYLRRFVEMMHFEAVGQTAESANARLSQAALPANKTAHTAVRPTEDKDLVAPQLLRALSSI